MKAAAVQNLSGCLSWYVYTTAVSNQRVRKVEQEQFTFEYFDNKVRDP